MRNLSINLASPDFEDHVSSTFSSTTSSLNDLTHSNLYIRTVRCW